MGSPRILFVGVEENTEMVKLKESVDDCLYSLGFLPEQRKFVPHLTIGRVRQRINLSGEVPRIESPLFYITNVTIFRSELKNTGSVHIPLKKFELK